MKTFFILKIMLLWAYVMSAQTNTTKTVRIKKIENVNGVEKVWDTSYTTNSAEPLLIGTGNSKTEIFKGKEGERTETMFVTSSCEGKGNGTYTYKMMFTDSVSNNEMFRVIKSSEALTEEEEKAFAETWNANKPAHGDRIMQMDNVMVMLPPSTANTRARKIIMVKAIRIDDASPSETSRLKGNTDKKEGALQLDKINCYPNPANDKFGLSFNSNDKQDAVVELFSSDGSRVRSFNIKGMDGKFSAELDISNEAKGIYFVRISQGAESTTKKLIVE